MKYISYFNQKKEVIQGIFFSLFCFFSNFSISLQQIFYSLAFLIWTMDILITNYSQSKKINIKNIIFEAFKNFKKIEIFHYIFAWIIYRMFHVFISSDVSKEFQITKELLSILMLPLIIYSIKNEKWVKFGFIFLLSSGFLTAIYNIFKIILLNENPFNLSFRAGAFDNVSPLTYTGTMAFSIFLGILVSLIYFQNQKQKQLGIILLLFTLFSFFGFFLSGSKGGILAFITTLVFLMIVFLKKKRILIIPLILFFISFMIQNLTRFQNLLVDELIHNKRSRGMSSSQRIFLWETGFRIYINYPLFGTGEVEYKTIYQKYKDPNATDLAQKGSHMHNDFLDVLVRFGSIGFSIFIMFYLAPLITFFRRMDDILKSDDKWMLVFSIASILMMALMGMTQCHFRDDEVQILFWLAVGLFYRYMRKLDDGFEKRKIESRQD